MDSKHTPKEVAEKLISNTPQLGVYCEPKEAKQLAQAYLDLLETLQAVVPDINLLPGKVQRMIADTITKATS
jgi:hypothetical protein